MAENFTGPVVVTGNIQQKRSGPTRPAKFIIDANISMTPFLGITCENGHLAGPFATVESQTISVRDAFVSGDLQLTGSDVAEQFDLGRGRRRCGNGRSRDRGGPRLDRSIGTVHAGI